MDSLGASDFQDWEVTRLDANKESSKKSQKRHYSAHEVANILKAKEIDKILRKTDHAS